MRTKASALTKTKPGAIRWLALLALSTFTPQLSTVFAQATAFGYQACLNAGANPANGVFDFRFTIYDSTNLPGNVVSGPVTNSAVAVSNGLFSATLDFGSGVFTGPGRWLQVDVRTNGGAVFTALLPRQPILSVPYTIMANAAGNLLGTLPVAQLGGVIGNGQLANSSITVNAGAGLSGGGTVALGGGTSLAASLNHDATLIGNGGSTMLSLNLGNPNTWTAQQTFAGDLGASRLNIGTGHTLNGSYSTICGGSNNVASGTLAVVAGGAGNQALNDYSAIGGGSGNQAGAPNTTISGGGFNSISAYSPFCSIGGGYSNRISLIGTYCMIGGGFSNVISGAGMFGGSYGSLIGGGVANQIRGDNFFSTIAGGTGNIAQAECSGTTIGGGENNTVAAESNDNTIAGGNKNQIDVQTAGCVISGGRGNAIISGPPSLGTSGGTIGGGIGNSVTSGCGTVPGGENNVAYTYAFAAGRQAQALHQGAFVWADSQGGSFASTTNNQVSFRCQGGVCFTSGSGAANQAVSWTPGSASWSFSSDRELKDRVQAVDDQEVLRKVSRLPILEWSYKNQPERHIGAIAQDFHELFPFNENDKMLNDADLHGVAIAAIKGLNQVVKEKDAEIKELRQAISELRATVNALAEKSNGGAK